MRISNLPKGPDGKPLRSPGRPKGVPNKQSVEVKAAIEAAFEGAGGVEKFTAWAMGSPDLFYPLYVKLLPKDIHITGTLDIATAIKEARERLANGGQS